MQHSHIVGQIVFGFLVLLLIGLAVVMFRPRLRCVFLKGSGLTLAGLIALYLVGRGIAEFWVVHYSDPSSYHNDWGGPSLIGVFAVHSGPGMVVIISCIAWATRKLRKKSNS